ncbi:MAG: hypothetical protein HY760_03075, partial [Nitrospirae bacterium]|nr:hypothetical protein [Nitrospirota bacterium]
HFSLIHNDRSQLELPPVASLIERVTQIYGGETASRLTAVSREADGFEVTGLISTPPDAYPDRGMQEFFVNGRAVRNVSLSHGVSSAFQDLIPRGRHPAVFLFLRIPPDGVDVNVHPTKREVRFRDPSRIHEEVSRAVRSALGRGGISLDRAGGWHPGGETAVREGVSGYGLPTAFPDPALDRPAATGSAGVMDPALPQGEETARLFPDVRILGQLHQLYILAEVEGELRMIDQHAAHARKD